MGRREKAAYLRAVRPRYLCASPKDKGLILDEVSATLQCHRKSAIRALCKKVALPSPENQRRKKPVGRKSRVTEPDVLILQRLWKACDYACGKRLVAMLPIWLPFDEAKHNDYQIGQKDRLLSLSAATLDRHLKSERKRLGFKGRSGTKPGCILKSQIPIRTGPWDVDRPGYLEADTVAHCGHSLSGQFAWSLTTTDIYTGWTECRAVWHKQVRGIRDALLDIDQALPFTVLGIDTDNGNEFLNYTLIKCLQEHPDKPAFTRSRPYKKNDNAHVEQKNWTHVRQLYGYARIDNKQSLGAMNELYANECSWMSNLFTVTMKLKSKKKVGAKWVKTYEKPQTPLQRILDCEHIATHSKEQLKSLMHSLNPLELRDTINLKIKEIMATASVTPLLRQ